VKARKHQSVKALKHKGAKAINYIALKKATDLPRITNDICLVIVTLSAGG